GHRRYDKAASASRHEHGPGSSSMVEARASAIVGRRLLLTGGAGFIGSHIAERLAPDNEIVILDTLRRNALAGAGLDRHPHVTVLIGDVTDAESVRKAMEGCDAVVHLASIA